MAEQFYFNGNTALGNALEKCLVEAGFSRTSALADADYVFSYHSLLSQLEDAYFDAKGYLAQAKKGACLIDLSPATPELVREISAISSTSGLFYVEAPLSVKDATLDDAFAQQSNLSCCVAGDKPDIAKAQKVLQHFVGTIRVTGEPGSAQLAHAAWTLQHTAKLFAAIEAEALYRAFLRIPTTAAAASAAGASPAGDAEAAIAQAVAQKHFAGTYTVEMFMADLSAALTAAEEADLSLPQAEACMNLLELLAIIGGSDLSPVSLALIYDEEEAAATCGLDWSRTQEYTQELGAHEHEHHHGGAAGEGSAESDADSCDGTLDDFDAQLDSFSGFDNSADAMDDDFDEFSSGDDDDDDFGGYADLLNR